MLSSAEVERYFDVPRSPNWVLGRRGSGLFVLDSNRAPWLLRSRGEWVKDFHFMQIPRHATSVSTMFGVITLQSPFMGIRPALWLCLEP